MCVFLVIYEVKKFVDPLESSVSVKMRKRCTELIKFRPGIPVDKIYFPTCNLSVYRRHGPTFMPKFCKAFKAWD